MKQVPQLDPEGCSKKTLSYVHTCMHRLGLMLTQYQRACEWCETAVVSRAPEGPYIATRMRTCQTHGHYTGCVGEWNCLGNLGNPGHMGSKTCQCTGMSKGLSGTLGHPTLLKMGCYSSTTMCQYWDKCLTY